MKNENRKNKNWVWIETDLEKSDYEWLKLFNLMRCSGIDAILPEIFNSYNAFYASQHLPVGGKWLERIIPLAKSEGLEVHAWMWCLRCNIEEILNEHPEWFVVNGKMESSVVKPSYINTYRFLCPSNVEVHEFLKKRVSELANINDLDGIHLDFIRLPDVIIAEALQPKYNVLQDKEYPEFDYCYCDVCRNLFKEQKGIDPLELDDPSKNEDWLKFRYNSITNLVNQKLVPIAKSNNKKISAAVFPNWESVRQQWMHWDLDAFFPMLYHNFYNGDIEWIKTFTQKGVSDLARKAELYSGLFIPELNPEDLVNAVQASINAGANGISLYHNNVMSEKHWELFNAFMNSIRKN